jgi:hypothetical protein
LASVSANAQIQRRLAAPEFINMSSFHFDWTARGRVLRLTWLFIIAVLITVQSALATTVALLSSSSELATVVDVLSVPLSRMTNVTLVDRAEIQRVFREQELALTQSDGAIKAGRLLNAAGIVLLQKRLSQEGKDMLSIRTIAVGPGVIVLHEEFPLPLADPTSWATSYVSRIEGVIPKLNVQAKDAVPISIRSLRSSVSTGEGLALETELTTLLRIRLSQEPSVFVLERRDMESLQSEKQIGAQEEPFWNGAFVIDGVINRDNVSQTELVIDARVAAPNKPVANIRGSGNRKSITAVVDNLATNILSHVGKSGSLPIWQTVAEAEKFFEEAQWAARWGLWAQARDAADASWALGKQTSLVGAYRVTSRSWLCLGMRGQARYEPTDAYGFRRQLDPEILSALTQMIDIYRAQFTQFAAPSNATQVAWESVGLDLLLVSSAVLHAFHENAELREGREVQLREVRAACRDLNSLLLTTIGSRIKTWRRDIQGFPNLRSHTRNGPVSRLAEAWLDSNAVWFEKPEDAVNLYREMLVSNEYFYLRYALLFNAGQLNRYREIPLTGWSSQDRSRLNELWTDFARGMTASSNLQMRLDGYRLILVHSIEPRELEVSAEQMLNEAQSNRVVIFKENIDAPVTETISNALRRVSTWGLPTTEQRLSAVMSTAIGRLGEDDSELSYAIWNQLLADLVNTNSRSIRLREPRTPPSQERIAELIEKLETIGREKRTRWPTRGYVETLRRYQNAAVPTHTVAAIAAPRNESTPEALRFSKVWHLGKLKLPQGRTVDPTRYVQTFQRAFWQASNLWLEVQTYGTEHQGHTPKLAAVRLDPLLMQSEVILAPFERSYPNMNYERQFLVMGPDLLIAHGNALWRRNPSGSWDKFPLPTDNGGVLHRWGKRIAISTMGGILDFTPETGDVRVLASMRRNPASTSLDTRTLNQVHLAVWPDGKLCASVDGVAWLWDEKASDWRAFAAATNCMAQSIELQTEGILFRQGSGNSMWMKQFGAPVFSGQPCGPLLFGGWRPNRSKLEYYTWAPVRNGRRGGYADTFTPPRWRHPSSSFPQDCQAQFDGGNVWVFPAPFEERHFEIELASVDGSGRSKPQSNYVSKTILFFDGQQNETVELQIRFDGEAGAFSELYEREHAQGRQHTEFIYSDQGIAIVIPTQGILFWAPKQEVETAVAQARKRALPGYSISENGTEHFDRDGSGWLDDVEDRAKRKDPGWRKLQSDRISALAASNVRSNSAQWDKVFAESDRNRDGLLYGAEIEAAMVAQPAVFGHRAIGLNGSITSVLPPFNLNSDLGLDRTEFRNFLAEPRLAAERTRVPDWVEQFGLKIEQCDKNDDGVLDTAERTQTLMLIRQRVRK